MDIGIIFTVYLQLHTIPYPPLLNLYENAKLLLAELSDLQKWGTNRLLCRVTLSIGLSDQLQFDKFLFNQKKPGKAERVPLVMNQRCAYSWGRSSFQNIVFIIWVLPSYMSRDVCTIWYQVENRIHLGNQAKLCKKQ